MGRTVSQSRRESTVGYDDENKLALDRRGGKVRIGSVTHSSRCYVPTDEGEVDERKEGV